MAKKRFGKRTLAMLLSFIMILSMVNISVLAAGETPDLVRNYTDTYYKQDGSAGTAEDWEIHLSKQAAATKTTNVYDITLSVQTKNTSVQLGGATHGAVALVLDVSNSMNKRYAGCTAEGCGKDEGASVHHEFRSVLGILCLDCFQSRSAHSNSHEYQGDSDTHLKNLQDAVSDFLDSYMDNVAQGDKRLVSVVVFGTDAVTIQSWVDVTDPSELNSVKSLINSLSTGNGAYQGRTYLTNGGTNIEAGLVLGRNMLNDSGALAGIPTGNQALILFSDGAPTAQVGNVSNNSTTKVGYGGTDTGSQTDAVDYDDVAGILANISATTIAVEYNYEDENNVLAGFDRVISSSADTLSVDLTGEAGNVVTVETVPTVITDPMGEGVTLLGENENYETGAWKLSGYTPVVSDGITTYTIAYQVEIDPTAIDTAPDHEGYTILTPANGTTTLDYTVGEDKTPVQAEFNVPSIRGILPRFDLTVSYVDEDGETIAEQIAQTGILYGTGYTTEQKDIEGYTFENLAEGSDAVSGTVDADKTVTYVYSKNPIPKYTVSYEYINAPEDAPELPGTVEYEAGAAVIVAAAPVLAGYTFSGWDRTDFEMPTENVVIKGTWSAIPKYTVSYEYINAPEGAPELPASVEYAAGTAVTVAADAYMEGYIFSGWDRENFEMPAEAVVIRGSWTIIPPNKYNVVYQYEGEIPANPPTLPETKQYEAGQSVTVAAEPALEGYTFSGWDKADFEMPAEDVFITGGWTKLPEPKHPVSYEYINAPEGAPDLPATVEYEAGTAVTVADEPYLAGYTFSGWDKKDFTMPAEAVVITGSWEKNPEPKYPVSYEYTDDVPGGAPGLPATVSYEAGTAVTVADEPYLAGYTFSGWDKEDFEMPAEAVIIRGSWIKNVPPPPVVVEARGQFVLSFDKAVAGDTYQMKADDFSFQLKDAERVDDGSGIIRIGENSMTHKETYTARNDGGGKVSFTVPFVKDLSGWENTGYTAAGTFIYTLSEVPGSIPGMSYNNTQYTILVKLLFEQAGTDWNYEIDKVTVIHSGETEVEAQFAQGSSVIHLSLGEAALYTNTYDDGTGSLTITKTIAGKVKVPGKLGFRVGGPEGFERFVSYTEFVDGAYTLDGLAAGEYTVTEENAKVSGYFLKTKGEGKVEVVANGNAQVDIVNTYTKLIIIPSRPPVTPVTPVVPITPVTPVDPVTPIDPPVEIPEEDVPLVEIPEEDVPLVEIPEEDVPLVEIPEEDVPLVEIPEEDVPLVEIPEEDVPLADVPRTDDRMTVYLVLTLLSGAGLLVLAAEDKKRHTI